MMDEGAASSSRGVVARIVLLAMSLVLSACGPDPTGEKPGSGRDAGAPPADAASGGDSPLDHSPVADGAPADGRDGGSATYAGGDLVSKGDRFNFAPSTRTVVPVAVFSTAGA